MNVRPKGENHWYNPSRDMMNVWPSVLIRAAAFAMDPSSSIHQWLASQISKDDMLQKVRAQLSTLFDVLHESRTSNLSDVLTDQRVDWPVFQAIMFGAGIIMFKDFNMFFRESRMTAGGGAVLEPLREVDKERALRRFDELVNH